MNGIVVYFDCFFFLFLFLILIDSNTASIFINFILFFYLFIIFFPLSHLSRLFQNMTSHYYFFSFDNNYTFFSLSSVVNHLATRVSTHGSLLLFSRPFLLFLKIFLPFLVRISLFFFLCFFFSFLSQQVSPEYP